MYGMQATKLYHEKEPKEHPGKIGIEEVLQIRPETHTP